MKYIIKELFNTLGHILGGYLISYLLLPNANLLVLVLLISSFGSIREHIQDLRGHLNNPVWIKYIDTLGWTIGSILYFFIKKPNKYISHNKKKVLSVFMLNLICSILICYLFIPTAELWILIIFTLTIGVLHVVSHHTHIPEKPQINTSLPILNNKIQDNKHNDNLIDNKQIDTSTLNYLKDISILGWILGAIIYYVLKQSKILNAD